MFAGKKSAQIREILISESAWEEMTCLFAPSLAMYQLRNKVNYLNSKENIIQSDVDGLFDEYKSIWEKDSQEWNNIHKEYIESKNIKSEVQYDGTTQK